jgi:hypothetical protein
MRYVGGVAALHALHAEAIGGVVRPVRQPVRSDGDVAECLDRQDAFSPIGVTARVALALCEFYAGAHFPQ